MSVATGAWIMHLLPEPHEQGETAPRIAEMLTLTTRTVERHLATLEREGLADRETRLGERALWWRAKH